MSIGNLENSSIDRTVLDDWESIIYVLCWMGTIGINEKDQELCKAMRAVDKTTVHIYKWREGSNIEIAEAKRNDMDLFKYFYDRIVSRFYVDGSYRPLQRLVTQLWYRLMNNPMVSKRAHGTTAQIDDSMFGMDNLNIQQQDTRTDYWDSKCSEKVTDPFVRRVACADNIAKSLLQVMSTARKEAMDRMYGCVAGTPDQPMDEGDPKDGTHYGDQE
ncbi:hypothetical protein H4R99_001643 [Coemansia sp. RSA 1722]|nr:hypothetical protein H4R99_001643 [Coemansia sp. RSA 1722]